MIRSGTPFTATVDGSYWATGTDWGPAIAAQLATSGVVVETLSPGVPSLLDQVFAGDLLKTPYHATIAGHLTQDFLSAGELQTAIGVAFAFTIGQPSAVTLGKDFGQAAPTAATSATGGVLDRVAGVLQGVQTTTLVLGGLIVVGLVVAIGWGPKTAKLVPR